MSKLVDSLNILGHNVTTTDGWLTANVHYPSNEVLELGMIDPPEAKDDTRHRWTIADIETAIRYDEYLSKLPTPSYT